MHVNMHLHAGQGREPGEDGAGDGVFRVILARIDEGGGTSLYSELRISERK